MAQFYYFLSVMISESLTLKKIMVNQKNSDIFLQWKFYSGDLLSKGRPKGDHFGQKSP